MCGRERSPYRSLSRYEPIADECVVRNEERCGERSLQQSDDSFTASEGLQDRVDFAMEEDLLLPGSMAQRLMEISSSFSVLKADYDDENDDEDDSEKLEYYAPGPDQGSPRGPKRGFHWDTLHPPSTTRVEPVI